MATYVIHHNDFDGFACKYAAWSMLQESAVYHAAKSYNDPFPFTLTSEDVVYILDFSYSVKDLLGIKSKCKELLVIDHHKAICEEIMSCPELKDNIIYSDNKAACLLCWEYFKKNTDYPSLFKICDDYDRYILDYPFSNAVNSLIMNEVKDNMYEWYKLVCFNSEYELFIKKAKVIQEYMNSVVNKSVENNIKYIYKYEGLNVALFNCTYLPNEISAAIYNRPDIDFTICYSFTNEGIVKFNLRSSKQKDIDVSAIARELGGGGHKNASGINMPFDRGVLFLKQFFDQNGSHRKNRLIFVFGSNISGVHGLGSAKHARFHYGAKLGVGIGRTGDAYAIPTKDYNLKVLPVESIKKYVDDFLAYAKDHPYLTFKLVRIGCGLAGYKDSDIAPLFNGISDNCIIPDEWKEFITVNT